MSYFNKIKGYPKELQGRFNSFITTQFDDSLSVEMQLRSLIKWITSSIDLVNDMTDYLNMFIETFDDRLQVEIVKRLNEWLEDGTLAEIINKDVFDMKLDREEFNTYQNQVNRQLNDLQQSVDQRLNDLQQSVDRQLDEFLGETKDIVDSVQSDLYSRGVNPLNPPEGYEPAVGDGVADDTEPLQQLLNDFSHVLSPIDVTYRVTDTIRVPTRTMFQAVAPISSGTDDVQPQIIYDGVVDNRKTVVLLGENDVGAEPNQAAHGVLFRNFVVNANKKAGIGVYGTYLSQGTFVDNISVWHSLEHNFYLARSWYATYINLNSKTCRMNGFTFGMPLRFSDGSEVNWTTDNAIEMNNTKIDNIRSHMSGQYYSVEHPGLFDSQNKTHLRQGYGIGAGVGNGFNLSNFLSENSGGVNLYSYTSSQPSKWIQKGYLENAMLNSRVANSDKCQLFIENIWRSGGGYVIEDIQFHEGSGGIYFSGEDRPVLLKNVWTPSFLESLDGHSTYELYQIVLKDNVSSTCGFCNTTDKNAIPQQETFNTRYHWEMPTPYGSSKYKMLFMRVVSGTPQGGYRAHRYTGEKDDYTYSNDLTNEFQFIRFISGDVELISKAGGEGSTDGEVEFRILTVPRTHVAG